MSNQLRSITPLAVVTLSMTVFAGGLSADEKKDQAALVGEEISIIANHLSLRPKTVLDFTKASGEYCYFMGWNGHHTHFAANPGATQEDTLDFVDARPMVKAGANFDNLPRFPGQLGKMAPGQWYLLPAGQVDLHHGRKWDFPVLLRASNIE